MKKFNTIDYKEVLAASLTVQDAYDGISPLSGYLGSHDRSGPMVYKLEQLWCETFGCEYAVAVNSGTSGLLAACMAIGIKTGDEVIVSPYTMSATAAAPKLLGADIVFADIEPDTFCLDPDEVRDAITPKTKAVIVTNLFGHPARLFELRAICELYGITLIEDNAQAIFAKENNFYTGTIGDIGVFSLNVHKQLQVGEGGVIVTDDAELAVKLREAMNHGEMRGGILGLNLRMTEVTAAMALEQLKKSDSIIPGRRDIAETIDFHVDNLGLPIFLPDERPGCISSYYCWTGLLDGDHSMVINPPFNAGYMRPLYELPALRQRIRLPVVEHVESHMILLEICSISPTADEIRTMVENLGVQICQSGNGEKQKIG